MPCVRLQLDHDLHKPVYKPDGDMLQTKSKLLLTVTENTPRTALEQFPTISSSRLNNCGLPYQSNVDWT